MEISFTKISALWINDKGEVLVVRGAKDSFYKALGGKVEEGESDIDCLKREIKEEVMCDMNSAEFFLELKAHPTQNDPSIFFDARFYIVNVEGEPKLNPEDQTVEVLWLGKDAFESGKYELTSMLQGIIFPSLIEKGLIY
jgi:8-oxo-dGTP diphosphatase